MQLLASRLSFVGSMNGDKHMDTIRSFDGTLIAFLRTGTGPPLVLVHGGTADHTRWAPILPALERHATLYALDRRGRGESGDTQPYAIEREFEDVAAVIDSIGEPADVLGHSFGAVCAMEAALLTGNIRKLILYEPPPVGAAGLLPSAVALRMQALLDSGDRDGVLATFLLDVAELPQAQVELMRSVPAWHGRLAAAHTILREVQALEALPPLDAGRYRDLAVPTLLLLGGDSPRLYRDSIEAVRAALPNGRLAVLPGQQHVAINTAPEMFAREVIAFLDE
jgi:pimeloyl-ACP methyl ester carboxylesterase